MILQATNTHLYPGHRGKISGLARVADLQSGKDCLVEFSDGSATAGRITKSGADWRLDTKAYRTAVGTKIVPKRWLVRLEQSDGGLEFLISERASGRM